MGVIFGVHNEIGTLFDESIYQAAVEVRCKEAGLTVDREVPIHVSFEGFRKTYRMDLVVERRVVYELKTVEAIAPAHRNQLLNYLFLSRFEHGKLVNLRPASVASEFLNAIATLEERKQVCLHDQGWKNLCAESARLRQLVLALIEDWGLFLDTELYQEAITFLLDEFSGLTAEIGAHVNGTPLGTLRIPQIAPGMAFRISAAKSSRSFPCAVQTFEKNLGRLLSCTDLKAIHWINFDRHNVTMKTLTKT